MSRNLSQVIAGEFAKGTFTPAGKNKPGNFPALVSNAE